MFSYVVCIIDLFVILFLSLSLKRGVFYFFGGSGCVGAFLFI